FGCLAWIAGSKRGQDSPVACCMLTCRPVDERSKNVQGECARLQPVPDATKLRPAGGLNDRAVKLGVGVEESSHVAIGAGSLHRTQQPLQIGKVIFADAADR